MLKTLLPDNLVYEKNLPYGRIFSLAKILGTNISLHYGTHKVNGHFCIFNLKITGKNTIICLVDFLVAHTSIVCMVKNKIWHSNLIFLVIIQKYQKKGEISSEFIRPKLLSMAMFSTKKSSHLGAFFCGQCPLVLSFLLLVDIRR